MRHVLLAILAAAPLLSMPAGAQNRSTRQDSETATRVLEQCVALMDTQNRLMDAFTPNTVPDQLSQSTWWLLARAALSTMGVVSRGCCPDFEAQYKGIADRMEGTEPQDEARHSEARLRISAEFLNVVRQVTACVEDVAIEQERRLLR